MKKILILLAFIYSVKSIGQISVTTVNKYDNKVIGNIVCLYIPNGKDFIERSPYMNFKNTIDSYISKKGSGVYVFDNKIIKGNHRWYRVSNVIPGNEQLYSIFEIQKPYKFFKPKYLKFKTPNMIDAQIKFKVGYHLITDDAPNRVGPWRLCYKDKNGYKCYFSNDKFINNNNCPSGYFNRWDMDFHYNSLTYKIFWCGDGILNSPIGNNYSNGTFIEDCDPNDPEKKNWGEKGCDCNCKKSN